MNLIAAFETPDQHSRPVPLNDGTLLVGRDSEAGLFLDHPQVSRKHARIIVPEGKAFCMVEDCGSANGTFIEGIPVEGREELHPDQSLNIGPFKFRLFSHPQDPAEDHVPLQSKGFDPRYEEIIDKAVRSLSVKEADDEISRDGLDNSTSSTRKQLYKKVLELLPPNSDISMAEDLTDKAMRQSLGLGPLEEWLADPAISEIMINGTESSYLEINGTLSSVRPPFRCPSSLTRAIDRILLPLGRRVDESSPFVDGRLPDGSRLNVIIPPLSLVGPVLTIRKFPQEKLTIGKLIEFGTLSNEAAEYLASAVKGKRNILVSGGTGTGKTTLLNALAANVPPGERIISIEDAAELSLHQEHVVRLETRPPNLEGDGAVTPRDLLRNSLRMRPDRIIVGECRGGEALDMLQAMNTGHEGSMTTCHANSPRDALRRIETMALMAGIDLPHKIIREQVANAIHLVVQINREKHGQRKVVHIVEVTGQEADQILFHPLFQRSTESGELVETGLSGGLPDAFSPGGY
jgi:pilus assembly protein CpaF